ncbi:polyprenyl diphosphate synthase [Paraferrimonas sp. SM1919]|uniref:polyprenyl diphosphate synthase n=1 Tax=Paraferrimonas sp. SM1919 TaxID=2662263 RepID=UPI001F097EBC|nr:polyprenyl diphosphate synthase [Paraferrimonas sp. SM1919]
MSVPKNANHKAIIPPQHVAIIMDGNGRWAQQRFRPRVFGHQAGVKAVRRAVKAAIEHGVKSLTLFAFSSENWSRPENEVNLLMQLFMKVLQREIKLLDKNGVKLKIIGDLSRFSESLQTQINKAEQQTTNNNILTLNVAANYGGCWDITQSAQQLAQQVAKGELKPEQITEQKIAQNLCMAEQGPVDLLIRTGGDLRISNFVLWQAAYAELYFSKELWPDFDETCFENAVIEFSSRQRRFGKTGEQVEANS